MYVIVLRFGEEKERAGRFMEGHKAWIRKGIEEGVFLLVGMLQPGAGGVILANGTSLADLRTRVDEDPFVAEKVVTAEILEITPHTTDPRLEFLAA